MIISNLTPQQEERRLETVLSQMEFKKIDITDRYEEWLRVCFALGDTFGEGGRTYFHRVSRLSPTKYNREDCDRKYDNILKTSRHKHTMGSFYDLAKQYGVDTSLPDDLKQELGLEQKAVSRKHGRPPMSEEEKKEKKKNQYVVMSNAISEMAEFRYNVLSETTESRFKDEESIVWTVVDNRVRNTLRGRLLKDGVPCPKEWIDSFMESSDTSVSYNPVSAFCESLPTWNPHKKDYIGEMFGYIKLAETEEEVFARSMAKKWFVWLVARACDATDKPQQLTLGLVGEKTGTGKTSFFRHLIPEPLMAYVYSPTDLSSFKDKDESIHTSHSILFMLDEVKFNAKSFNKFKNMAGGAGAWNVNERGAYERNAKNYKVHASFAFTTNDLNFLPEEAGLRRFVVLNVAGSEDYKTLPKVVSQAWAQAWYYAQHPEKYSLSISREEMDKLEEINRKYAKSDNIMALLPVVLRAPRTQEEGIWAQNGEIQQWICQYFGNRKEVNDTSVGKALTKMGLVAKNLHGRKYYRVVRLQENDRNHERQLVEKEFGGAV